MIRDPYKPLFGQSPPTLPESHDKSFLIRSTETGTRNISPSPVRKSVPRSSGLDELLKRKHYVRVCTSGERNDLGALQRVRELVSAGSRWSLLCESMILPTLCGLVTGCVEA